MLGAATTVLGVGGVAPGEAHCADAARLCCRPFKRPSAAALPCSWASGKSFMDGLVQAYGNLYKVPGKPHLVRFALFCSFVPLLTPALRSCVGHLRHSAAPSKPCLASASPSTCFLHYPSPLPPTHTWPPTHPHTGTTVLGDVNLAATALNNLTFFLGTFTFALILGVITDEVSNR